MESGGSVQVALTPTPAPQNPALHKRTLARLTHVSPMLNAATAVAINTAVVAGANAFGVQVAGDMTNGYQSGHTRDGSKVRWGWGSSRVKQPPTATTAQSPVVVKRTCCGNFFGQLGVIAQLMRHRHPWCSLNSRKGVLGRAERMMLFAVSFFVSLAVLALQYDVVRCVILVFVAARATFDATMHHFSGGGSGARQHFLQRRHQRCAYQQLGGRLCVATCAADDSSSNVRRWHRALSLPASHTRRITVHRRHLGSERRPVRQLTEPEMMLQMAASVVYKRRAFAKMNARRRERMAAESIRLTREAIRRSPRRGCCSLCCRRAATSPGVDEAQYVSTPMESPKNDSDGFRSAVLPTVCATAGLFPSSDHDPLTVFIAHRVRS